MPYYELVLVLSPVLTPEETDETLGRVKELVQKNNGDINHEERWGMRRLAYPIQKAGQSFIEGNYILARFSMDGTVPLELQTHMKLSVGIIRHLLVKTDPPVETDLEPQNGTADAKTLDTSDSPVLDEVLSDDTAVQAEDVVDPKVEAIEPETEAEKLVQEGNEEHTGNIVAKDDSKAANEDGIQVENDQETDNDHSNDGEPQAAEDSDLSEPESTVLEVPEVLDENDDAPPTEEAAKKKRTRKPKAEKE